MIDIVANIATLRTTEPTTAQQLIHVTEYSAGSVTGGGFFQFDSVDTTSADDGGLIIVTAGGHRWKRERHSDASLTDFGAINGTDCTASFLRVISSKIGSIFIPNGTWGYSAKLDFGAMRVRGEGPYPGKGSRLLCMDVTGILSCDSGAHWSGLFIDGNGSGATDSVGAYGLRIGATYSQFTIFESISVRYFTKYGVILDQIQNSELVKINAQYNAVNFLFCNGARNVVLSGCNAALDIQPSTGRNASHRNILMATITDDPNLSNSTITQSNSRILFNGGIFEYADYADANIELQYAGASSANDIHFIGTEITEALDTGYLIDIQKGSVKLDAVQLNGNASAPAVHIASGARLIIPDDGTFGGGSTRGWTHHNKGLIADVGSVVIFGRPGSGLPMAANANMIGNGSEWTNVGEGTITYNDVLEAIDVVWPFANRGAKYNWASNIGQVYAGQLFRIRGKITLLSGTNFPQLSFQLKSGTGGVILASVNGDFDVLYRMAGNENTALQLIGTSGEGSARIEAFTMEMMNLPR